MYVKRHAVARGEKRYVYLRLVQAYRDEHGRVRHRVLRTLGREDELKASGQLEQLMGSFARLDPPLVGVRREVGPLLLAAHFCVARSGRRGRSGAAAARASAVERGRGVAALIASRLCSPSPLYDIAGWASGTGLQELVGIPPALLNDDRLGRALETFAVHAEAVRGALAARAIERFGIDAGRLHVDLTTLRVAGAYEHSALVAKGWGPDRRVARQVRALQATSAGGVSVYVRPDPGNAAEVALIGASLERLRELSGPAGLLVCDAACGHPKTLAEIARSGLRFIVPLRASMGFRERYLHDVGDAALRRSPTSPSASASCPRAAHALSRRAGGLANHRPRDRRAARAARRLHPLLRRATRGRRRPRARADQGRGRARSPPARPRRAPLQARRQSTRAWPRSSPAPSKA